MLNIPASIIEVKNSLAESGPFLLLLEIQLPDAGTTLYLVRNNENISWNGETWVAFPFTIDDIGESRKGEVPSIALRVSNITRAIQSYIEQVDGGVDSNVILRVVHADHLSELNPILRLDFVVTNTHADSKQVTFTLGASNPWMKRFPLNRVRKNFCRWRKFKGTHCAYVGPETQCDRTLTQCRAYNNSHRFGAFVGAGIGGLKL